MDQPHGSVFLDDGGTVSITSIAVEYLDARLSLMERERRVSLTLAYRVMFIEPCTVVEESPCLADCLFPLPVVYTTAAVSRRFLRTFRRAASCCWTFLLRCHISYVVLNEGL